MSLTPIAILGAGSWGSALAWLLGTKGLEVRLWSRSADQAREMVAAGRNEPFLPGLALPPSVRATSDLPDALAGAALVIGAVPAQALRETLRAARPTLQAPLVIVAKGLEEHTGRRLSEVAGEELGAEAPVAVLSGPNLAGEIVRGIPTATVAASSDAVLVSSLRDVFGTPRFRVYGNRDVAGVELGGALKNPIAVAAGISDGLGFGNNTKATLLTRGLAEMIRLGVAAGGLPATFTGLSGLGDLMATAHSPLSRNYRLGFALGRGEPLETAQEALGHVAEGVATTGAACVLAGQLEVEIPIIRELEGVLFRGNPAAEAVDRLMSRPYRDEEHL